MELPIALESALKALLNHHSIFSWKIAGDGPSLAVILRLRPETQQGENHVVVHDRVSYMYRRKPPGQISRDKRRAEEFRQRRENIDKTTVVEQKDDNRSDNTFASTADAPSENQNKKSDEVGEHTCGDSSVTDTKRAARGKEETATVACDTETDNSDTETTNESESECEPSTKSIARDLARDAKRLLSMPDLLKLEERNNTFEKVMIDRRGRVPKLMCVTTDLIATCELGSSETNFQLRDAEDIYPYLPFWYHWPEISREGNYKDMIDKMMIEMKELLSQIREFN